MKRFLIVVVLFLLFIIQPLTNSFAGGIRGSMFNLPPAKTPIADNEQIQIRITDVEENRVILPLDENGNRFTDDRVRGTELVVTGPSFVFTIPPKPNTDRRVLTIQFFRDNPQQRVPPRQTQILQFVVVETEPGRLLNIDVVVPQPQPEHCWPMQCRSGCYEQQKHRTRCMCWR